MQWIFADCSSSMKQRPWSPCADLVLCMVAWYWHMCYAFKWNEELTGIDEHSSEKWQTHWVGGARGIQVLYITTTSTLKLHLLFCVGMMQRCPLSHHQSIGELRWCYWVFIIRVVTHANHSRDKAHTNYLQGWCNKWEYTCGSCSDNGPTGQNILSL